MTRRPARRVALPDRAPDQDRAPPAAREPSTAETAAGDGALFDFEILTPEVGLMFLGVGVLGVILPGLPGLPFFLVGGAVLVPGGKRRISRWIGDDPKPLVRRSLDVVGRFMDDLDARYPRRRAS
jgi:hypothetical protein